MATSDPKDGDTIRFCKPFDEDDADLIIRSSDNVYFRVHKLILRKASIVFDGMVIIPTDDEQPVVQTVSLEEDGVTISGFLHLCYPFGGSPEIGSLDAVSTLLGVCDKYQAHGLAEKLGRAELTKFVDEDPLRVYVLACRASILEVTQRAAYGCLTLPLETIVSSTVQELRQLSASLYRSLLVYYTKCRRTAASLLVSGNIPWVESASEYCWFAEDGHNDCPTSNMVYHYLEEGIWKAATTREWWCNIMAPAEDYLLYQAPPLSPRLGKRIPIPTPRRFQCKYCKERYDRDMRHFFTCLEAEMSKRVKNVEFKFVT